jgi:hypothetical protein
MNEQLNVEKIDYLIKYLELLVKVHETGLKMHHEINMAIKQLERDMNLDGSSYVVVQNGEVLIKNCTFSPADNEETSIKVNDGKLSFHGLNIGDDPKIKVTGSTVIGKTIHLSKGTTISGKFDDNEIEKLIEEGKQNDGTFNDDTLTKLKSMGVTLEFLSRGIRWFRN